MSFVRRNGSELPFENITWSGMNVFRKKEWLGTSFENITWSGMNVFRNKDGAFICKVSCISLQWVKWSDYNLTRKWAYPLLFMANVWVSRLLIEVPRRPAEDGITGLWNMARMSIWNSIILWLCIMKCAWFHLFVQHKTATTTTTATTTRATTTRATTRATTLDILGKLQWN